MIRIKISKFCKFAFTRWTGSDQIEDWKVQIVWFSASPVSKHPSSDKSIFLHVLGRCITNWEASQGKHDTQVLFKFCCGCLFFLFRWMTTYIFLNTHLKSCVCLTHPPSPPQLACQYKNPAQRAWTPAMQSKAENLSICLPRQYKQTNTRKAGMFAPILASPESTVCSRSHLTPCPAQPCPLTTQRATPHQGEERWVSNRKLHGKFSNPNIPFDIFWETPF